MHRFLLFVISALLLESSSLAAPAEDVKAQVLRCLKMPPDAPTSYRFILRMQIIDGVVKLAAVNFPENRAPSAWEMAALKAIADAATDCEPYGKLSAIFTIAVDAKLVERTTAK